MTIIEYYKELQSIIDDYYEGDSIYEKAHNELQELIIKAKDSGLKVNTKMKLLNEIEPFTYSYGSSYGDDYDYDYDDLNE
jgi:hypothetical protein